MQAPYSFFKSFDLTVIVSNTFLFLSATKSKKVVKGNRLETFRPNHFLILPNTLAPHTTVNKVACTNGYGRCVTFFTLQHQIIDFAFCFPHYKMGLLLY